LKVLYALFGVVFLILFAFFGVLGLGWYSLFAKIIPFFAVVIFVIGLIFRVVKWAKSPVPFHIPTVHGQQKSLPWIKSDKIDSPTSTAGVIARILLEVLLFRSLFRNDKFQIENRKGLIFKGNRLLWLGGLVFHWSLLIIIFRHLRLFTQPVPGFVILVRDMDSILQGLIPILYITDIAIVIALTYLFIRRIVYPQIRYISLASDYFAIFLLLGVVVCGVLMRLFYPVDYESIKELAMSILTLNPVIPVGVSSIFYVHIFLVSILVAYFPFSKLVHAAGILLSPTRNLKNNSRQQRHVNPWDYPVKVHTYEEYEDEFREAMRKVGLPLEKE